MRGGNLMGGGGRKLGCGYIVKNVNSLGTGIFGDKFLLWYVSSA